MDVILLEEIRNFTNSNTSKPLNQLIEQLLQSKVTSSQDTIAKMIKIKLGELVPSDAILIKKINITTSLAPDNNTIFQFKATKSGSVKLYLHGTTNGTTYNNAAIIVYNGKTKICQVSTNNNNPTNEKTFEVEAGVTYTVNGGYNNGSSTVTIHEVSIRGECKIPEPVVEV